MLQVKVYVDKSKIQGLGLFAAEFIAKDTIVWEYNPLFTAKITKHQIENMSSKELEYLKLHDYYWVDEDGSYMFPLDNSRFTNHSTNPNVVNLGEDKTISCKDIFPGEEITMDYKTLVPSEYWEEYYFI